MPVVLQAVLRVALLFRPVLLAVVAVQPYLGAAASIEEIAEDQNCSDQDDRKQNTAAASGLWRSGNRVGHWISVTRIV
ncbi:hypothetical protein HGG75_02620 [Ochrobactrum pseudogrignonense]|nr:hypothetical protein [Brucella pseudogrignonensis]